MRLRTLITDATKGMAMQRGDIATIHLSYRFKRYAQQSRVFYTAVGFAFIHALILGYGTSDFVFWGTLILMLIGIILVLYESYRLEPIEQLPDVPPVTSDQVSSTFALLPTFSWVTIITLGVCEGVFAGGLAASYTADHTLQIACGILTGTVVMAFLWVFSDPPKKTGA